MNDVVSLDSVRRRGRSRPSAPESGADGAGTPEPAEFAPRRGRGSHPAGRDAVTERTAKSPEPERTAESSEPVDLPFLAPARMAEPVELPVRVEVSDEERLERVSDTVVRALGRRQLSSAETHDLLVAQGATGEEADGLVARYEELGYLNDFALAEALVARLSERSQKSRAVIARELHARKIPSEFVGVALENLDDDHEFELAVEAAVKRVGQLSRYDDETVERRLNGFLARRGFSSGIVREATRRAMATRKATNRVRFR